MDKNNDIFTEEMQEIVESFVTETRELLEDLEQDLLKLETNETDSDLINKVFRTIHTIKGTSGFLELEQLAELAHEIENVLNKLRHNELSISTTLLDVIFDAYEYLKQLFRQVETRNIQPIDLQDILKQLQALHTPGEKVPTSGKKSAAGSARRSKKTKRKMTSQSAPTESEPNTTVMFSDEMSEILASFIVETQEIFEHLDQDLLELEKNFTDDELLNRIFRAIHTVKGTSGFLNFEPMSRLAHHFEDVLNKLRKHELDFQPEMLDILISAFDAMKALLQQVIDRQLKPIELTHIIQQLQNLSGGNIKGASRKQHSRRKSSQVASSDSSMKASPTAPARQQKHSQSAPKLSLNMADTTIRVSVRRLDSLMNLVGELVLARNRLSQLIENMRFEVTRNELVTDFVEAGSQIDFITTELQNAIMKTRMVPVGRVFNRFPRLVRDIAREFSKEIELVIEGANTEMDKSVIEEIGDPLLHLVRNSADHGIESPEERRKAGKPPRGVIRLSAEHEGNHIVVVVEDDGRGIDPEKIKESAIKKGFLTPEAAAEMNEAEVYNLIFAPGFSTSAKVTSISGRGVGMDVVKTNITRLNGMVSVQSTPGKGTKFFLKLPLTLAIIQGLLVRIGTETFAIPLSAVSEVVRITPMDINQLQGREVIRLRERILPLIELSDVIEGIAAPAPRERCYVVVLGIGERFFGLKVQRLIGQKEIVIKPLGAYLKHVPGIAGSTILGDGRVIMILDIGEILKLLNNKISSTGHHGDSGFSDG